MMDMLKKPDKATFLHTIGVVVLMGSQGLLSVVAVRMGSYSDAGILALATGVGYVFGNIGNFGIRAYMITDTQTKYSQADYQLLQIVTITLSIILCVFYGLLLQDFQWAERSAIIMFVLYLGCNSFSDLLLGRLQIAGHLEINGYSNILRGILGLSAFVFAYFLSGKLVISLSTMTLAAMTVLICFDAVKYRETIGKVAIFIDGRKAMIIPMIKACFPIMLANVLPIATNAVSKQIIREQLGQEALGIFSSVFLPTALLTTVAPALNLASIPKLAAHWHERRVKKFSVTAIRNCVVVFVLTAAGILLSVTFGKPIMRLLFGAGITEYMPLLYWAILATGLNALCAVGKNILISMRKGPWITISAAISIVGVTLLSKPMITNYRIYGAAFAMSIAYGMQVMFQIIVVVGSVLTVKHGICKGGAKE